MGQLLVVAFGSIQSGSQIIEEIDGQLIKQYNDIYILFNETFIQCFREKKWAKTNTKRLNTLKSIWCYTTQKDYYWLNYIPWIDEMVNDEEWCKIDVFIDERWGWWCTKLKKKIWK